MTAPALPQLLAAITLAPADHFPLEQLDAVYRIVERAPARDEQRLHALREVIAQSFALANRLHSAKGIREAAEQLRGQAGNEHSRFRKAELLAQAGRLVEIAGRLERGEQPEHNGAAATVEA